MKILFASILSGIGLACLIYRPSFLGFMMGAQMILWGAALFLIISAKQTGFFLEGHLFGVFIVLVGLTHLAGGIAIAVRLFFLKKRAQIRELHILKY